MALALVTLATAPACDTPGLWQGEPARSCAQAIVSGTRDDEAPFRYPFTGVVHTTERAADGTQLEGLCTATLLTCGAAVTAAHCVAAKNREVLPTGPIDTSFFASPYGIADAAYNARFHRVHVHPAYEPAARGESPSSAQIAADVAVLELTYEDANAGPEDLLARKLGRLRLEWPRLGSAGSFEAGTTAWAVGYGNALSLGGLCGHEPDELEECDGMFCEPKAFEHRRFASAWIESVGGEAMRSHVTIASGEACGMMAPGDSGGPLFLDDGRTVVAIASATNASPQRPCSASRAWFANLTAPETASWLASVLAGMDRDHDGIPDACDPCPASAERRDSDRNAVPDECE